MRDFALVLVNTSAVLFLCNPSIPEEGDSRVDFAAAQCNRCPLLCLQVLLILDILESLRCLNSQFCHQVNLISFHSQQLKQAYKVCLVNLTDHRAIRAAALDSVLVTVPLRLPVVARPAAKARPQRRIAVLFGKRLTVSAVGDACEGIWIRRLLHPVVHWTAQRALAPHLGHPIQ